MKNLWIILGNVCKLSVNNQKSSAVVLNVYCHELGPTFPYDNDDDDDKFY